MKTGTFSFDESRIAPEVEPAARVNPKVVDFYHGNADPNWKQMWDDGIRGVIHKASEGLEPDPSYERRRNECFRETPDMLWGAYHFMRPGDPTNQITTFLKVVAPGASVPTQFPRRMLYALDHEDPKVPLWAARTWLERVRLIINKFPVLYSGYLIRQQEENRHAPEFASFPLWLPEFGPAPKIPYPWKKLFLWQYTDGAQGARPRKLRGFQRGVDISSYDGTDEELREAWVG